MQCQGCEGEDKLASECYIKQLDRFIHCCKDLAEQEQQGGGKIGMGSSDLFEGKRAHWRCIHLSEKRRIEGGEEMSLFCDRHRPDDARMCRETTGRAYFGQLI